MSVLTVHARLLGVCCLLGVAIGQGWGADDAVTPARQRQVRQEVARLVHNLDSSRYEVRQEASRQLDQLVSTPSLGDLMAAEFQQLSVRPELSFEVRWHVNRWRSRLPQSAEDPPPTATSEEIDRLVRQLDDESYSVRLGAVERLQWLSGNGKLAGSIMALVKRRLADPDLSAEAFARLDAVRRTISAAWLASDPTDWNMPAVSSEQLDRWIEDMAQPTAGSERTPSWRRQQIARQELLDVLVQDAQVSRVEAALTRRLAKTQQVEAAGRLKELLDLTRPSMVAEFWQGRRMLGEQHLIVGVPSQTAGAIRPSHFDRIDDRVAHCVSGNSLSPGEYPVGVAFPHPTRPDAVFRLVNLPTPRRQIAYSYCVKTDPARRLAALSRRTLDRFLAQKHLLRDTEVAMLAQLDAKEVSRFAGRYFLVIDDGQIEEDNESPRWVGSPGGQASRHGMICARLALEGTREAVPGLLEALDKKRFLPPTSVGPYQFAWLAALAIAGRDPWPDVDRWLAGLIDQDLALVEGRPDGPELGATAARLLLSRHDESPQSYSLERTPESLLLAFGVEGFRFHQPSDARKVQQWWKRHKDKE